MLDSISFRSAKGFFEKKCFGSAQQPNSHRASPIQS
nr:hypothetical protein [Tanacetum cinerariifolium]